MKSTLAAEQAIHLSIEPVLLTASHQRTLEALFRHPVAHNLEWADALSLVEAIGEVEHKSNDKCMLDVGGERYLMHQPQSKQLTEREVIDLRKFLVRADWSEQGGSDTVTTASAIKPDLLVFADHHEARIYRIGVDPHDEQKQCIEPYDPHHFLHHLTHHEQDRARGQRAPEDPSYYGRIAEALSNGRRIVVIGHGTGHSNAAHHLVDYMRAHDRETYTRIVAEVVADLSSLTPPQLLDIAIVALDKGFA